MRAPGAVLLLLCHLVMQGQQATGEVRLEVKDTSGAPMQASAKLVSVTAGVERRGDTDALGVATFSMLSPGRYQLEVSKAGFNTQSLVLDVPAGSSLVRTITMVVGALSSRVDVVATTPLP